jgi:hypothetical protein
MAAPVNASVDTLPNVEAALDAVAVAPVEEAAVASNSFVARLAWPIATFRLVASPMISTSRTLAAPGILHLLVLLACLPNLGQGAHLHDHVVGGFQSLRALPPRREMIHEDSADHGLRHASHAPVDTILDKQRPIVLLICGPLGQELRRDSRSQPVGVRDSED